MRTKRILSLLVAICMIIAILPVGAVTAVAEGNGPSKTGETTINGIVYALYSDNTATVTGVSSNFDRSKDIQIISSVESTGQSYSVTAIGDNAFNGKGTFTGNLIIPNSVKSIGDHAFFNCSGLMGDLTIPDSVTKISQYAFYNCKGFTGAFTISDNVEFIGAYAFSNCSGLKGNFHIPNQLTTIENYAFAGCKGLTGTLDLPNVTSIGVEAFSGCTGLTGTLVIPNSVTSIGKQAFYNCSALSGDTIIPNTVTNIGESAFYPTGIKRLILSKDIQSGTKISNQNVNIYYPGTRTELESVLSNVTFAGLDKNTLKIGTKYICYLCDVNFDTDGGTPENDAQTNIYRMDFLDTNKIATPSKEGYLFGGWYYEDSAGKKISFNPSKEKIPDSITLIAQWKQPASIDVSGLPAETLVKGKQYPFVVSVDPHDDIGTGILNFDFSGEDEQIYRQLDDGSLERIIGKSLSVSMIRKDYRFALVSGKTGPDNMTVTLTNNGVTSDTATVDFTAREHINAYVSIIGLGEASLKQGEKQEFIVKVTPNDDSGKAYLDFGKDNADIEYQDGDSWENIPNDGLAIDLDIGEQEYTFRLTPRFGGNNQSLRVTVKPEDSDFGKDEVSVDVVTKVNKSLTVINGTVKVNGQEIVLDSDDECDVEEGSSVEVTFDKTTLSDAQIFDQWSIKPDSVLNAVDPKAEIITFKMPAEKVTIEAMTRDATIQEEPNVLGTVAMVATAGVGAAVVGYTGYMIGTELYLNTVLPEGTAIPNNATELALLVWTDAGKPAPAAVLAADATDEQKALTWAVENQLISADKAADASVTRWEVIDAWNKAQEMKG